MKFPFFILSLAALSVTAEITPSTEFGDVPPDATLSQVLSGADGATKEYVNSATGGVIRMVADAATAKADKTNTYTKAETDAKIIELSPPTSLEPATNYTDRATGEVIRIVGDLASNVSVVASNVSRLASSKADADYVPPAISNATGRIDADLTAYVTVTYDNWTPSHSPIPDNPQDGDVYYSDVAYWSEYGGWASAKYRFDIDEGGWIYTLPTLMSGDYANPDATELTFPDGTTTYRKRTITTKLATTNDIVRLAPAPGNYAVVSNAAMSAIKAVTNADANLIYTITSDGEDPRFYFTPVGAIDPED